MNIKHLVKRLLNSLGLDVIRPEAKLDMDAVPPDFSRADAQIWKSVRASTLTSRERIKAAVDAARYVCRHQVVGDIVECGVWKGGSTMAMIMGLLECAGPERNIYLYDTFTGMNEPGEVDVSLYGEIAIQNSKKPQALKERVLTGVILL